MCASLLDQRQKLLARGEANRARDTGATIIDESVEGFRVDNLVDSVSGTTLSLKQLITMPGEELLVYWFQEFETGS